MTKTGLVEGKCPVEVDTSNGVIEADGQARLNRGAHVPHHIEPSTKRAMPDSRRAATLPVQGVTPSGRLPFLRSTRNVKRALVRRAQAGAVVGGQLVCRFRRAGEQFFSNRVDDERARRAGRLA